MLDLDLIIINKALMNGYFTYVTVIFDLLADPVENKDSLTIEHKYLILVYVTLLNICLIFGFVKYAVKVFQKYV